MKTKLILAIFASILIGCAEDTQQQSQPQFQNDEMKFVPEGAIFIRSYNTPSGYNRWTKWKLENDCYISYNVIGKDGLLAKTTCDDSVNVK